MSRPRTDAARDEGVVTSMIDRVPGASPTLKGVRLGVVVGLIIAGIFSCSVRPESQPSENVSGQATGSMLSRLEKSRKVWIEKREAHHGSYRYIVESTSWTGFRTTTTLVVRDGSVVERHYASSTPDDPGGPRAESWRETEPDRLGSHPGGAALETIDELYEECAESVLTRPTSENELVLELRDDGILRRCVYVPHGCADDCEMGVRVDGIAFGASSGALD